MFAKKIKSFILLLQIFATSVKQTFSLSESVISYRNVQAHDIAKIAKLCVDSFEEPFEWYEGIIKQGKILQARSELQDRFERFVNGGKKHAMVVALERNGLPSTGDDETVVGFLEVGLLPSPIDKSLEVPYLGNVAVSESYRKRGIGSRLVRTGIKIAEKWGDGALFAAVESDNDTAIKLYEKLGFITISCAARDNMPVKAADIVNVDINANIDAPIGIGQDRSINSNSQSKLNKSTKKRVFMKVDIERTSTD